jgi:hypothetical protein
MLPVTGHGHAHVHRRDILRAMSDPILHRVGIVEITVECYRAAITPGQTEAFGGACRTVPLKLPYATGEDGAAASVTNGSPNLLHRRGILATLRDTITHGLASDAKAHSPLNEREIIMHGLAFGSYLMRRCMASLVVIAPLSL